MTKTEKPPQVKRMSNTGKMNWGVNGTVHFDAEITGDEVLLDGGSFSVPIGVFLDMAKWVAEVTATEPKEKKAK